MTPEKRTFCAWLNMDDRLEVFPFDTRSHRVTPIALAMTGFHGPYLHLYHHQTTVPLIVREGGQYLAIVLTLEGCSPSGEYGASLIFCDEILQRKGP
jgi:hypothetical protein